MIEDPSKFDFNTPEDVVQQFNLNVGIFHSELEGNEKVQDISATQDKLRNTRCEQLSGQERSVYLDEVKNLGIQESKLRLYVNQYIVYLVCSLVLNDAYHGNEDISHLQILEQAIARLSDTEIFDEAKAVWGNETAKFPLRIMYPVHHVIIDARETLFDLLSQLRESEKKDKTQLTKPN
ncbi:hypothetical protein KKC44_02110 [Patescibacteria group bacterium]|nr:hypothetical protein [Patescibacteria group bacterium]